MRCLVLVGSPSSGLRIEYCCFFLDSLFFEESSVKISKFFSTSWTSWELVQQVLHVQPYFINVLPCFDHLSLIWAHNWGIYC